MTRTFVKLHGAWSGEPMYIDVDTIVNTGKNPEELSETTVTTRDHILVLVAETPDEVMELILDAGHAIVIESDAYEKRRDEELAAIAERAAQKESIA